MANDGKLEKQYQRCVSLLEETLQTNESAKLLIKKIESIGCTIPNDFFKCRPCENNKIGGGFIIHGEGADDGEKPPAEPEIIICQDAGVDRQTFQHIVVHELVHAYDQCRARLDVQNCLHIACTEIRASALSGECTWSHELFRGHAKMLNGHPECVKRRAAISVNGHNHCKGLGEEAVETIFEKCYRDTNPFTDTK